MILSHSGGTYIYISLAGQCVKSAHNYSKIRFSHKSSPEQCCFVSGYLPVLLTLAPFLKAKVFSKVVLPAPLAPIMAMNCPGSTIPDTVGVC